MRLLIVEDERPIAGYIERLCRSILGKKIQSLRVLHSLDDALDYLFDHTIDLCLLDLNLHGQDGYDILKKAVSGTFHTIVISANTDRAVEAFEYGILDFIPKPFDEARLQKAFDRYLEQSEDQHIYTKYLSVRSGLDIHILKIKDIRYFKAAGNYIEAVLLSGKVELLDKTMDRLHQILPSQFIRIHRSFIVDIEQIVSFAHAGRGTYQVTLINDEKLPLSRSHYKKLQK